MAEHYRVRPRKVHELIYKEKRGATHVDGLDQVWILEPTAIHEYDKKRAQIDNQSRKSLKMVRL